MEVYKRTYWGNGIESNRIDWGSVLFPINREYVKRVLNDNGTIEAVECFINQR